MTFTTPTRLRATLIALVTAAFAIALVVLIAHDTNEPAPVHDRDGILRIKVGEYDLRPQNITVKTGPIRLQAINVGVLTHNVVVETDSDPDNGGVQPTQYLRSATTHAGQHSQVTAAAYLKPGRYRIADTIGNHENLGAYGTLTVTR